jgi:AcrR family transcriptional regulator
MPKKVDHGERRREIIEALWRVAAQRGLAAVSFREVAAEARVSVRRVQYYFGTKAQLLAAAIQLLGERIVARGLARMAELGPEPTTRALLRAAIVGSLPSDDETSTDALLFLTFYIAAMTDTSLQSADALAAPRQTVGAVIDLIQRAAEAGETRAGVDPHKDGQMILAANTGLILAVLAGQQTYQQAMATMDHQLDRLFKARPRQTGPQRQ